MSLRRKDDWDGAQEEANRNIAEPPAVTDIYYNYGQIYTITRAELFGETDEQSNPRTD